LERLVTTPPRLREGLMDTLTDVDDYLLAPDLAGCNDVDSHEMLPIHMWPEVFGEAGQRFVDTCSNMTIFDEAAENSLRRNDLEGDAMEINDASVWGVRGPSAPSAIDLRRRAEVMDTMGVGKTLVFPTFALCGQILVYNPIAHLIMGYDPDEIDGVAMGRSVIRAHNDWAIRTMQELGDDRVRPVGLLVSDTVEAMIEDAQELIDSGILAIQLANGVPPAGLSPAHERLDPFWALLAEANVPFTMHLGTESPLLASNAWSEDVPLFAQSINSTAEFTLQPYWGATVHVATENFLTAMILGGVLERHPTLRVGSIEVGAQWVGPLAERLDLWAHEFRRRYDGVLSLKPSEYMNRQVRANPFHFEDVRMYFTRHTDLQDVYCFSTDYPHREGGYFAKETFRRKLAGFDDAIVHKFFVDNGELLLP
jgi:predicted TIM-barrel fold metal-dependent hydrolase